MRHRFLDLAGVVGRVEKMLIRALILASLVLVIAQMGLARNPLDFYLTMAAKVENTPLDVAASALTEQPADEQGYMLVLKAVPQAAVRVWQNGQLVGDLSQGTFEAQVLKGQILLDGRTISKTVRVQVVQKDKRLQEPHLNQTYVIQGNVQALQVSP